MDGHGTATSTILFTDVVGSTEVRAPLDERAAEGLFLRHQHRLSLLITEAGGQVVKVAAEGIMAAFAAASDAVAAAMVLQRDTHRVAADMRLRIGAAAGDVSWEDGDCFGPTVMVAARLQAIAEGGQILVTNVVRSLAGDRVQARYKSLGARVLEGIQEPVDVFGVGWDPAVVDNVAAPTTAPLPAQLRAIAGPDFVGRNGEWKTVVDVWRQAQQRAGRVLLLGGEAGAGKTRLATQLAVHCHDTGAAVLFGSCDSELAIPYQPWLQALDHLVRSLPHDTPTASIGAALSELALVLPQFEQFAPQRPRAEPTDPENERHKLFAAVAALIAEAAVRRPLLLVLDDLHWAGSQTLALLRHLVRGGLPAHVMVIGAFRDGGDEVTKALAGCLSDLRRIDSVTRMRLDGLDLAAVESLVAQAIGRDIDRDVRNLAAIVASRTGGNAFYVKELLDHLVSVGAVCDEQQSDVLDVVRAEAAVPDSVREVVMARLARLSPSARTLTQLAAVAGQRCDVRVLGRAHGRVEADLLDEIDEIIAAGLFVDASGPSLSYHFAHALVRDAVVSTVSAANRARMHRQVAEAIESVFESDRRPVLAELARHFAASAQLGDSGKALYYGRRAATQAVRSAAYPEATSHLRTALALVPERSTVRADLLADLGAVQVRDGRYEQSRQSCEEAFRIALELGDASTAGRAAIGFETALHFPGLPGGPAVELLEEAIELVGDTDLRMRARLEASLGRALAHAGRADESLETAERAIELSRRTADPETLAAALAAAMIAASDPKTLIELSDEMDPLARRLGDLWSAAYASATRFRALIMLGRLDEARDTLARHRIHSTAARFQAFIFMTHAYEVVLALADGDLSAAEAAADRAHEIGAAGDTPFDEGVYGLQMFAIRREQGRLGEVASVLRFVASQSDQPHMWRPGLAALYAELGMLDDARKEFASLEPGRFGAVPRDSVWPACVSFLVDVCVALEDAASAAILYDELLPLRGLNLMAGMTVCFGPADRYLGRLAALGGNDETAQQHYVAALALAARSGSPLWTAHTQYDLARLKVALGDMGEAREFSAEAIATAQALGLAALAGRPLLGDAVKPVGGARTAYPDGLSAREVEVLELVARGLSNRAIGERLFISQNTVANHVRAVLHKTGSANRAEAVGYGAHHGLLGGEGPIDSQK